MSRSVSFCRSRRGEEETITLETPFFAVHQLRPAKLFVSCIYCDEIRWLVHASRA